MTHHWGYVWVGGWQNPGKTHPPPPVSFSNALASSTPSHCSVHCWTLTCSMSQREDGGQFFPLFGGHFLKFLFHSEHFEYAQVVWGVYVSHPPQMGGNGGKYRGIEGGGGKFCAPVHRGPGTM